MNPDTSGIAEVIDGSSGSAISSENTNKIQFKRSANFKQGVIVTYSDDLNGVLGNFQLFHSEAIADLSSYQTFKNFISDPLTMPLALTQSFYIGSRSADNALLRVSPTVVIDESMLIDKKVLGIGNSYKDTNKTVLLFEKNSNIDKNGKLPLLEKSKGSENMFINFDFDVNYFQT